MAESPLNTKTRLSSNKRSTDQTGTSNALGRQMDVLVKLLIYDCLQAMSAVTCLHAILCDFTQCACKSQICRCKQTIQESVRTLCKLPSLDQVVAHRRLRWLGHTARMSQDRLPYQCMFGQLSGTQAQGKPRDTWQSTVYKDLSTLHVQYSWFRLAHGRTG